MKLIVLIALIGVAAVVAECPNACSGNGVCGAKDACACYKNYQGNDCSERTCPFGYAHVDTPKGDLDGDGDVDTTTTVDSAGSIVYGATGTQEQFPDGADYEAHFYMECANKGLCNRKTGECDCLDGYEGTACQRASCPNACSGHGTCESIKELAELGPETRNVNDASTARGATTYELWDRDIGMGCLCDPEYQGADCSERVCKYGVDPLYDDDAEGTAVYEEVFIAVTSGGVDDIAGTYKLRFFDVFGEDWETEAIPVDGTATTFCDNTVAALEGLPNGVIPVDSVACDAGVDSTYNINAVIAFEGNPGHLRTAEVLDDSTTGTDSAVALYPSPRNGEFTDDYATESSLTVDTLDGTATTLVLSADGSSDFSAGDLIKVGKHRLGVSSISTDTITLLGSYQGGDAAGAFIYTSAATTETVQDSGATDLTAAVSVGSSTITFSGTVDNLSRGSVIYLEDRYYTVRSVSGTDVVVDEVFSGTRAAQTEGTMTADNFFTDATASATWVVTAGASSTTYEYVSECSGRGTCDRSTGLCKCFKGYANDNCDTQNALAA